MKILFVNFIKFWGGGESWNFQLMDELRKRNHEIVLLANSTSKLLTKANENDFETHAVTVSKLSFLNPFTLSEIKRKLVEIKPDIIILNSTLELKTIGFHINVGCKKVLLLRGIPSPIKLDLLKRYLFSNVVTNVIVNSDYVKNSLSNLDRFLKNSPEVIYHGIQTESTKTAKTDSNNIAIVGRLSHEKGVDIALRVMQLVVKEQPDAKLWVIGDGKEKENLVQLAAELGITKSIVFKGFVHNVEELLVQCSMLILPSRWEGFGLVLLEAMKLKMPCIAFNHTAANEIIIENHTGFLIPDMNISIMADKIVYLLSNKELTMQLGLNGNMLLKQKFSIENCIDKHEKLILN